MKPQQERRQDSITRQLRRWSQGPFKKVVRGWKSFFLKDILRN